MADIWFSPSVTISGTSTPQNIFASIVDAAAPFQTLMGTVTVFKMYEVMSAVYPGDLPAFFSYLSEKGVLLGVEALGLVATEGNPGYAVEGFSEHSTDLAELFNVIKDAGGDVKFVAWDEPFWFGYYSTSFYTQAEIVAQLANSRTIIRGIFPDIIIGDIEPVTTDLAEVTALQSFFTAYAAETGEQFAFFEADLEHWESGWQTVLASLITACHANSIQIGVIVNGDYDDITTSNAEWVEKAIALIDGLLADSSLTPDHYIVQSWQQYPSPAMDPTDDTTLAYVLAHAESVAGGSPTTITVNATLGALTSTINLTTPDIPCTLTVDGTLGALTSTISINSGTPLSSPSDNGALMLLL